MQRYRLNVKLLIFLAIGSIVFVGSVHLLHGYQVRRNSGSSLARAIEAMDNEDFREASGYYRQYTALKPDDEQGLIGYANSTADLAESGDATFEEISLAYSLLETTIRELPENDALRRRMVDFLMKFARSRLNDAIEHLQLLLRSSPSDSELGHLYVQCLAGTMQLEEAINLSSIMVGLDRTTREFSDELPEQVPDAWEETWPGLWATGTDNSEIYALLATLLRRQHDDAELADQVMDQLVAINPDDPKAFLRRAIYRRANDDMAGAKEDVDQALVLDADDIEVILAATSIAITEEDYDTARTQIENGVEHFPLDARVYQAFATLEVAQKDFAAALAHVDRGLENVPDSFTLLHQMVNIQIELQDVEGVRATIKTMEENEFPPALRDFANARLLMLDEKWLEARTELDRVRLAPAGTPNGATLGPRVDVLLAQCYERLGQNDIAADRYERAFNADPTLTNARIGMERLRNTGMRRQAANREANPLQVEVNKQLSLPEGQQDWEALDDYFDRLIEARDLEGVTVDILRAQFMSMRKQFGEARSILNKARNDYPDEPRVLIAAAQLMAQDPAGEVSRGLSLLDRAEDEFGATLGIRVVKAELLLKIGGEDLPERLAALEANVDSLTAEEQKTFWRAMGSAYQLAKMPSEAQRTFQNVVENDPADLAMQVRLFDLALANGDDEEVQKAQDGILEMVGTKDDSTWQYCEASRLLRRVRLEIMAKKPLDVAVLAESQALVDKIREARPRWYQTYQLQALIDTFKADYDSAITNFNSALDFGPANPALASRLVHLLYIRNRPAEAWEMLQLIPEWRLTTLPPKVVAMVSLQTDHIDEALVAAKEVVSDAPEDAAERLWYAQVLDAAKQGPETETAIREAIGIDPSLPGAWIALISHLAKTNQSEKAEEEMQRLQSNVAPEILPLVLARCSEALGKKQEAERYYLQTLENNPSNIATLQAVATYYLGENYDGTDGRAKANPLLDTIVANTPQTPGQINLILLWARRERAKSYAATNIYGEVVKAIKLLDDNAYNGRSMRDDILLMAGILALRTDVTSRRKAIELFEQIKQVEQVQNVTPLTSQHLLALAQLYFQDKRWAECQEQILELLVRDDRDVRVLASYCSMLIERGEIDEANRWLQTLVRIDPNSNVTLGLRASVLAKQGNAPQAVALLTALIPDMPDPTSVNEQDLLTLGNVAQMLEKLELFDESEKLYRQLADLEPRGQLTLAGFVGRRGRTEEAFKLLEGVAPDLLPMLVVRVATDMIRSRRHEVGDRFDAQVQLWLDRLAKDNPNSTVVLLQLASFRDVQQNYDEAAKIYRDLLLRKDLALVSRATVQNNLAYILAMNEENTDEAEQLVAKAIALLGPSPELLDTRAMIRLAAGNSTDAIKDLTLVVSDQEKAAYYLHLASAQLAAGDTEAAREAYLRAEELGLAPDEIHPLERKRYDELLQALDISPAGQAA